MRAVADTSGLFAFFIRLDRFHERANTFLLEKPTLITTNYVIEETLALLYHRAKKPLALKALQLFKTLYADDIVYVTRSEHDAISDIFENSPLFIDFVDASVLWLSKTMDLPIFTFDAHFRKMKVKVVP